MSFRSEVVPFKYAGMMVVSQLVARIPLEQSILEKMIRLIWTVGLLHFPLGRSAVVNFPHFERITREHLDVALKTTMLICQECEIALLPTRSVGISSLAITDAMI